MRPRRFKALYQSPTERTFSRLARSLPDLALRDGALGDTSAEGNTGKLKMRPDEAIGQALAKRLLDTQGLLIEKLTEGNPVVIIETPSADLTGPVMDGLAQEVFGDITGDNEDEFLDRAARWLTFAPTGRERYRKPDEANASIRNALVQGRPIIGVCHSPERLLPPDLLRIAEHRLRVPHLDGATLSEAARLLTGYEPSVPMSDDNARYLTLDDLCLAVRPDMDADEWLGRALHLSNERARIPSLTLDRLHGMDEVVAWGRNLARDLADYQVGRIGWHEVDRGVLLIGPPGTGKTTAAAALAGTCGIPLISGSFARWQAAGHLGDMLKAMLADFEEARSRAPCVLFIDELDAVGDRARFSGRNSTYEIQVVNAFLEQLDGIASREGVIVVGATNWPERIDPAVRRPGRLDREIRISLPDAQSLRGILRFHLGRDLEGDDLSCVATLATGCSGAQAEQWVRDARRTARHARRPMVLNDLLAAVRAATPRLSAQERRRIAVHEAGHALVAALEKPGSVIRISTLSTMQTGGSVDTQFDGGLMLTPSGIHARLRYMLGGRAAEEAALGVPSSAAGGDEECDLARATSLALSAVTAMGMSQGSRRLLWIGIPDQDRLPIILAAGGPLADEVSTMLETAYAQALHAIREHRGALDEIVDALLKREVLQGSEVDAIVMRHRRATTRMSETREGIPESREVVAVRR
ncbi:MAG: AAA family ATPase [Acetobacteraceae bacterium]|nr:AAA family ATPase [Acetobacteraceae bacterium]